jgi:WD40 repeat protein
MPISMKCPGCGKTVKVAEAATERSLTCPHCKAALRSFEAPTRSVANPDAQVTQPPASAQPTKVDGLDLLAAPKELGENGMLGGYRIIKVLGQGGMGIVFQAEDLKLRRIVALKAMKLQIAADAEAGKRFLREARAAAAIEHDHIVPIYQVGEDRGVPFLAMQFLRGESLDDRLHRVPVLPVLEVLRIGREIAEGLQAAHERGLIHRDIKPANIWLEEGRDRVKIVDFGLVRSTSGEDSSDLTQQGRIVGTAAYMAPEQGRGGPVDGRSDLFSLGCVLYRMATGEMPFRGTDFISMLMAVASDEPRLPRAINTAIPKELSDLILRLLAKDPGQRPETARATVEALAALERKLQPRPRQGLLLGLIAVLVLAVAGGSFLIAYKLFHPPVAGPPAELVLQTSSPDVILRIKQQGQEVGVLRAGTELSASLGPGDYDLELDAPAGLALPANRVTLSPGSVEPLRLEGEPLSQAALVHRPAPLPGVRSWTIETTSHRGPVYHVAFRPQGRMLASAGDDGVIRLWDLAPGKVRALVGHHSAVTALAWSRNGRLLASAGADHIPTFGRSTPRFSAGGVPAQFDDPTVRLWDADTGQQVHVLKGHEATVRALAWSPDNKTLASAGHDSTLRLWDAASGKLVKTIPGPREGIHALAWSPDGKLLASDARFGIEVREADSGKVVRTLGGHTSWIMALAFSPDGKLLASGSADATVRLWAAGSGKCVQTLKGAEGPVWSLAWHPRGQRVAAACEGKPVSVWSPASGARVLSWSAGDLSSLSWGPGGAQIATGSWRGVVQLWNAKNGNHQKTVAGRTRALVEHPLASSPDGRSFAISEGNFVRLRDAATGKVARAIRTGKTDVCALAWSPDSKRLASAGEVDNSVRLWEAGTGKAMPSALKGHKERITALAFSPDGAVLASAGKDATCLLWNVGKSQLLRALTGHTGEVSNVAFAPDGKTVATAGADRTVCLWDVVKGKEKWRGRHDGAVVHLTFSRKPSGQEALLASASTDTTVRLWQARTGKLLQTLAHEGPVQRAAWLPDGRTLASLDAGRRLRLWDAPEGQLLRSVPGVARHGQFSADGKWLAAGMPSDQSLSLRFFDTATGLPGGTLVLLQPNQPLVVSADGHYLAAPETEQELVCVVETEAGQETMRPAELAKRFGWKNDPAKARLVQISQGSGR